MALLSISQTNVVEPCKRPLVLACAPAMARVYQDGQAHRAVQGAAFGHETGVHRDTDPGVGTRGVARYPLKALSASIPVRFREYCELDDTSLVLTNQLSPNSIPPSCLVRWFEFTCTMHTAL